MEMQSIDLEQLVLIGRQQGFLTYEQVNHYLPDEANTAENSRESSAASARSADAAGSSDHHGLACSPAT